MLYYRNEDVFVFFYIMSYSQLPPKVLIKYLSTKKGNNYRYNDNILATVLYKISPLKYIGVKV